MKTTNPMSNVKHCGQKPTTWRERFERSASLYERQHLERLEDRMEKRRKAQHEDSEERRALINGVCQRDRYKRAKTAGIRSINERLSEQQAAE